MEIASPTLDAFASALQRRKNLWRNGALFGSEIAITRAHRESIRLARGRYTYDLFGHTQVTSCAANDHKLLIVFLAEQGDIRLHEIQQLSDDSRDAHEVSRSECTAQNVFQVRY